MSIFYYYKNNNLPPTAALIYSVTSFKDCSLASYCNLSAFIKQKMRSFRSLSVWKSARRKKISTLNKNKNYNISNTCLRSAPQFWKNCRCMCLIDLKKNQWNILVFNEYEWGKNPSRLKTNSSTSLSINRNKAQTWSVVSYYKATQKVSNQSTIHNGKTSGKLSWARMTERQWESLQPLKFYR